MTRRLSLTGSAFILWIMLLLVPYWGLAGWSDRVSLVAEQAAKPFQIAGFVIFISSVLVLTPRLFLISLRTSRTNLDFYLLNAFFLLIIAGSFFSLDPLKSAVYSATTFFVVIALKSLWENNNASPERFLYFIALLILAFLTLMALKNGLAKPNGGMQKNQYAKAAGVALALCFYQSGWKKWVPVFIALVLIILARSRSSLGTAIIFILAYQLIAIRRLYLPYILFILLPLALIFFSLIFDKPRDYFFSYFSDDIAAVGRYDDKSYRSDSSLTSIFGGRVDRWDIAFDAIADRPVLGYGFRTRGDTNYSTIYTIDKERINAHNGYLNLFLDTGIINGSIFLTAILISLYKRYMSVNTLVLSQNLDDQTSENAIRQRITFAFTLSTLFLLFSEPIYLNIGIPYSIIFLMLFFTPYEMR